jgi:hypothetical protein
MKKAVDQGGQISDNKVESQKAKEGNRETESINRNLSQQLFGHIGKSRDK